ncbi:CoxG family protein [Castellaniella sp.]|uniref:CoxG family protein n=1 Tax=Castellaniella sp. TaxID=1955812 RepID=UPI003563046D
MQMQGSRQLSVSQQQAWQALNDPEVLKACVPGCESIESTAENTYAVVSQIKVGPVAAKFKSTIELTDIQAPDSYTLNFDGNGGAAGFGKGTARVRLSPQGDGTQLDYDVQATVGGKIAQVGQRLIDGVAKSMSERFFKSFDEEMQRRHPAATQAQAAAADTPAAGARARMPGWAWGAIVVILIVLIAWASQG